MDEITYNSKSILTGLENCDRSTLASFLALFESHFLSLLSKGLYKTLGGMIDRLGKFSNKLTWPEALEKYHPSNLDKEQVAKLEAEILAYEQSNLSNEELQQRIWRHLVKAFSLPEKGTVKCPLKQQQAKALRRQVAKELSVQKESEKEGWIKYAPMKGSLKRFYNKFSSNPYEQVSFNFSQAVDYYCKMLDAKTNAAKTMEEFDAQTTSAVNQLDISEAQKHAITKMVASGSVLGPLVITETFGFSAYMVAAQSSAIIPFVGGKTMVTSLAFLSSLWFILPALLIAGGYGFYSTGNAVSRAIGLQLTVLLALRGEIPSNLLLEHVLLLEDKRQK